MCLIPMPTQEPIRRHLFGIFPPRSQSDVTSSEYSHSGANQMSPLRNIPTQEPIRRHLFGIFPPEHLVYSIFYMDVHDNVFSNPAPEGTTQRIRWSIMFHRGCALKKKAQPNTTNPNLWLGCWSQVHPSTYRPTKQTRFDQSNTF
jgi:hypothetical protein